MDIILGILVVIALFYLFATSEKINIHKKLSTAVFCGLITFTLISKRIPLLHQKIVLVIVLLVLIFAVNIRVNEQDKKEPPTLPKPDSKEKRRA